MKERIQKTQDSAVGDAEFAKSPTDDGLSGYMGGIHEESRFRSICSETVYSLLEESRQERSVVEVELSSPTSGICLITRELLNEYLREFDEFGVEKLEDEVRERIESEVREIEMLLERSRSLAA